MKNNFDNFDKISKILYIVGRLITLISVIIISIYFIFLGVLNINKTLSESHSPDGAIQLIIEYEDAFSFGPHKIDVFFKDANAIFKKKLFSTSISNDGASLKDKNYSINWINNNIVTITFMGNEQTNETYEIDFSQEPTFIEKYR